MQILQFAMNHDIPYMAFNITEDNCLNCGYIDEDSVFLDNGDKCPCCGSNNIQKPRRITGYLSYDYRYSFNKGKQMECVDRVKHSNFLHKNDIVWQKKEK